MEKSLIKEKIYKIAKYQLKIRSCDSSEKKNAYQNKLNSYLQILSQNGVSKNTIKNMMGGSLDEDLSEALERIESNKLTPANGGTLNNNNNKSDISQFNFKEIQTPKNFTDFWRNE